MIKSHQKKKEEVKNYKTNVLARQIEELRKDVPPLHIYDEDDESLMQHSSLDEDVSKCSTFDNVTPPRGHGQAELPRLPTYITQMAKVDMERRDGTVID